MQISGTYRTAATWFLISLVIDQVSKYFALHSQLSIFYNPGISFGFGEQLSVLLMSALVLAIAALLFVALKQFWFSHPALAGLFFGAVISNIIDRGVHVAVVDWIPIPFTSVHNNLADIFIVGVLGYRLLTDLQKERS